LNTYVYRRESFYTSQTTNYLSDYYQNNYNNTFVFNSAEELAITPHFLMMIADLSSTELLVRRTEYVFTCSYSLVVEEAIKKPMNSMKPLKKTVSLSLDHDVVEGIKTLAEESDRSFSQYVNMVLKRILKNKAERDQNEKEEE